jgi:hypothetical protein
VDRRVDISISDEHAVSIFGSEDFKVCDPCGIPLTSVVPYAFVVGNFWCGLLWRLFDINALWGC